ncbi:MAG: response regulator [Lacipirellulaceae bacterium]
MLVLSRRSKEKLSFPELGITVHFLRIQSGAVKVGVDAPPSIKIVRDEIAGSGKQAEETRRQLLRLPREVRHDIRNELHSISIGLHLYQEQMRVGDAKDAQETFDEIMAAVRRLDENDVLQRKPESKKPIYPRLSQLPDGEESSSNDRSVDKSANPRILLAEDDENEREMLAGFLRLGGLDVDTVGDGEQAVNYLSQNQRPGLLLLDMKMPLCDGPEVVRFVRSHEQQRDLTIFGVSGSTPEENNVAVGSQGVDRWISKPLDPPGLLKAVQETVVSC